MFHQLSLFLAELALLEEAEVEVEEEEEDEDEELQEDCCEFFVYYC